MNSSVGKVREVARFVKFVFDFMHERSELKSLSQLEVTLEDTNIPSKSLLLASLVSNPILTRQFVATEIRNLL